MRNTITPRVAATFGRWSHSAVTFGHLFHVEISDHKMRSEGCENGTGIFVMCEQQQQQHNNIHGARTKDILIGKGKYFQDAIAAGAMRVNTVNICQTNARVSTA